MKIRFEDRKDYPVWIWASPESFNTGAMMGAFYRLVFPARVCGGQIALLEASLNGKPKRAYDLQRWQDVHAIMKARDVVIYGLGNPTIVLAKDLSHISAGWLLIRELREAGAEVWLEHDDAMAADGVLDNSAELWADYGEYKLSELPFAAMFGLTREDTVSVAREAVRSTIIPPGPLYRSADVHLVATERLRAVVLAENPRADTRTAPNMIAPEMFPRTERAGGKIRAGYCGSHTHQRDMQLVLPALKQAGRLPNVEIHLWGVTPTKGDWLFEPAGPIERTFEGMKYTHHGSRRPYEEFCKEISILDIALAPLLDNEFNRCKSAQKWFEHSAHKTAMVLSDLEPYAMVEHGVTGLKARTAGEFTAALLLLCVDPELRARIGRAAHEDVMRHHTIEACAGIWRRAVLGEKAIAAGAAVEKGLCRFS